MLTHRVQQCFFLLPHILIKIEEFNGNHSFPFFSVWSLEKLANKIYDMRDLYNQCVEDNIPFSETVSPSLMYWSHFVPYHDLRAFPSIVIIVMLQMVGLARGHLLFV